MPTILKHLNKAYFWDVDFSQLDPEKSYRLIIERVMLYGNLKEIGSLNNYYGKAKIKSTLCTLNFIDPKNLNFFSLLFDTPKSQFKCYTRKQLISQPRSY